MSTARLRSSSARRTYIGHSHTRTKEKQPKSTYTSPRGALQFTIFKFSSGRIQTRSTRTTHWRTFKPMHISAHFSGSCHARRFESDPPVMRCVHDDSWHTTPRGSRFPNWCCRLARFPTDVALYVQCTDQELAAGRGAQRMQHKHMSTSTNPHPAAELCVYVCWKEMACVTGRADAD